MAIKFPTVMQGLPEGKQRVCNNSTNNSWQPLLSPLATHYFKCNTNVISFPPQHRTKRQVFIISIYRWKKSGTEGISYLPSADSNWQKGYQYPSDEALNQKSSL